MCHYTNHDGCWDQKVASYTFECDFAKWWICVWLRCQYIQSASPTCFALRWNDHGNGWVCEKHETFRIDLVPLCPESYIYFATGHQIVRWWSDGFVILSTPYYAGGVMRSISGGFLGGGLVRWVPVPTTQKSNSIKINGQVRHIRSLRT